ncbi:MAG: glycosyltransferase family 9 protein [Deltaproteobacteria bacterium]|nr:glycosyltransferase family 9 protein [Deltaproteobacteria bacterium]
MPTAAPDSVVVLRFSAVGDVILTAAALAALKKAWPTTRVVFVTKARLTCLVADNPNVDAVVGLEVGEGVRSLAARLGPERPGAVLDLHAKLRSAALRALLRAPRTVVWRKRPRWQTIKVRLRLGQHRAHGLVADRYHQAVEALVGAPLAFGELRFFVSPDARARLTEMLEETGLDRARPLIGMAPGSMWATKRWPLERFAALATRALEAGAQVVLSGSAEEAEVTAAVRALAPGVVDLAGKIGLGDLGAFVDCCTAFVANDSGPMHLSRALGVPTLAIFGSTDPAQFDFTGHALLFAGIPCAPCSLYGRRKCPLGHFRCMQTLAVDEAWRALSGLLAGPRRVAWVRG